jgi:hypothetical protein
MLDAWMDARMVGWNQVLANIFLVIEFMNLNR